MSLKVQSKTKKGVEEELLRVHKIICDVCLMPTADYLEKLYPYVSSDIKGFGTGVDESVFNKEDMFFIVKRSFEQLPQEMSYEYERLEHQIVGDCAFITCDIKMQFQVEDQRLALYPRLTAGYHRQKTSWVLVQFHGSFPSSEQAEGESWPVDALKARNKELEAIVSERTAELNQSLENLKSTQAQLIHSEKMASLGELTAGIAHEIQNPLNFINNFSEVSSELLTELKDEVKAGNEKDVIMIADDIDQNLQKIVHHGKRADGIVKGMLQHSRINNGEKEPTNINALADEYLHLSYHGLRAKDKSFNAHLITEFDDSLKEISVIPQDIGRVLLNIFNNAFYAVTERKKTENGAFEPLVHLKTEKKDDRVLISIRDNGNGIPQKVLDKIYQPFFTTKPPGEGTGLGLSLSYDIITKGHGGEMMVETNGGDGSVFIIKLPLEMKVNQNNLS